ncbi:uncharacterized protein DS421_4g123270 [Arachis hypogaea]|nr:uncharacterized protein DS421_4g123270 [Arachis hypogaea]
MVEAMGCRGCIGRDRGDQRWAARCAGCGVWGKKLFPLGGAGQTLAQTEAASVVGRWGRLASLLGWYT